MKNLILVALSLQILLSLSISIANADDNTGTTNVAPIKIIQCSDANENGLTVVIKLLSYLESKKVLDTKYAASTIINSSKDLPEFFNPLPSVAVERAISTRVIAGNSYSVELSNGDTISLRHIEFSAMPKSFPLMFSGQLNSSLVGLVSLNCEILH